AGWPPGPRPWLLVAGLYLVAAVAIAVLLPGAAGLFALRVAVVTGELLLLAVALPTGWRLAGRDRQWRWLLAGSVAIMFVTGVCYLVANPVGGSGEQQLRMTYGQLAYLLPMALLFAAVLYYPTCPAGGRPAGGGPPGRRWWITALLDSVIALVSVGMLGWALFLHRIVEAGVGDVEQLVVSLVMSAASLLLVCVALVRWTFRRPSPVRTFGWLAGGLAAISLSFLSYTATIATRRDPLPHDAEICWILAGWCLLLACLPTRNTPLTTVPAGTAHPGRDGRISLRWAHAVLPLLPLSVAGVSALVDLVVGNGLQIVDVVVLLALPPLVLARQMMILADNINLLRRLERSERRLHRQAFHDPLTGLPNRALFGERLERAVAAQSADGHALAVLYVDLDDFKHVNDTLGHAAGDRLLQITAGRLSRAVRVGDTVARLGGDEFAILLVSGDEAPAAIGSRVLTAVHAPTLLTGIRHNVRASVGLVVAQATEQLSADQLLHRADAAMYAAKGTGKGSLTIYHPGLEPGGNGGISLAPRTALIRALRGDGDRELRVVYQPIVDLPGGRPAGAHAELRWTHPAYGEVPAVALIATHERTGLLPALALTTLRRICADLPRLRASATPPPVHLPVHAVVPPSDTFVAAILDALGDGRLRPGELILDLFGADRGIDLATWEDRMVTLHRRGVGLCLADLGTADANMLLLCQLPVDMVTLIPEVTGVWTAAVAPATRIEDDRPPRLWQLRDSIRAYLRGLGVQIMATDLPSADAATRAVALGITLAAGRVPLPVPPPLPGTAVQPAAAPGRTWADGARTAGGRPGPIRAPPSATTRYVGTAG
ncbi:diguanylate cyclase, partial [Frankia sp. R82]|uniref:GGDEF domain-containing protein n=1 Tax=Frankia sp. R82 TaxID=2950553 RepID=UPI002042C205